MICLDMLHGCPVSRCLAWLEKCGAAVALFERANPTPKKKGPQPDDRNPFDFTSAPGVIRTPGTEIRNLKRAKMEDVDKTGNIAFTRVLWYKQ